MVGQTSIIPTEKFVNEKDYRIYHKHTGATSHSTVKQRLKSILGNSLIPSVAAISRANTRKEKIWKILMLFLCLLGYIYQAFDFFSYYFSYPTTVRIEEYTPSRIILPAITFCSNNRYELQSTCAWKRESCVMYDKDDFCEKYPRYCYPTKNRYPKIAKPNYSGFENFTLPRVTAPTIFDIIDRCFVIVYEKTTACNHGFKDDGIKRVPLATNKNEPALCYTIGSKIGKLDSKTDDFSTSLNYKFVLNTFQETYWDLDDDVMIHVTVHDSKKMANPFRDGIALRGGKKYKAFVSMTEVLRLPHPYDTNCEDYLSSWRRNGGAGAANTYECVERCKLLAIRKEKKCVDQHIAYPHYDDLCIFGQISMTEEINEKCLRECRPSCYDNTYEVKYIEQGIQELKCPSKNEGCMLQNIDLTFSFQQFRVTRHTHYPAMASSEMFSSMGSCLVMWLGISLLAILDIFEMIMKLIFHFLVCIKRKIC